GAERGLADGERAPVERLGAGELGAVDQELGDVDEGLGDVGGLGPELLLADGERASGERRGPRGARGGGELGDLLVEASGLGEAVGAVREGRGGGWRGEEQEGERGGAGRAEAHPARLAAAPARRASRSLRGAACRPA